MSEHQRETAFLRRIILYDDSEERRALEQDIARVQRHQRCVQRVAFVTALFPLLAIVGLVYGVLLRPDFPGSELVSTVLCAVGLAALICLAGFAGLLKVYRKQLNRLREECRWLVTRFLESNLGKPHLPTLRSSYRVPDEDAVFQRASAVRSGQIGSSSLI